MRRASCLAIRKSVSLPVLPAAVRNRGVALSSLKGWLLPGTRPCRFRGLRVPASRAACRHSRFRPMRPLFRRTTSLGTRQQCLSFSRQPLDQLGGRQRACQGGRLPGREWCKVALGRLAGGLA